MREGASSESVRPVIPFASAFGGERASEQPGLLGVRPVYHQRSATVWTVRLRRLANAVAAPLCHRARRGEGGLFVVNATLALKWHPLREAVGLAGVSLLCLLALYLFNDVVDAHDDQRNPKKDRLLAGLYARRRHGFLALWAAMSALAI